jgi:hypothetical protein
MEIEIWKDIEGYECLYQASNFGRIKCLYKIRNIGGRKNIRTYPEKIMKQRKLPQRNYMYIILCKDGVQRSFTVHRIIAKLFVENPENLPQVNHKDCDSFNNKSDNLEWCTGSQNMIHAFLNGKLPSVFNSIDRNPSMKKVRDIKTGTIYNSIIEASLDNHVSARSLYHQLAGTTKNKTSLIKL